MVQFGCCLPSASFVPQMGDSDLKSSDVLLDLKHGIGILSKNGYDFIELTVGSITCLSNDDFIDFKKFLNDSCVKVSIFNSFIPPTLPLTGNNVPHNEIENYLKLSMERISQIGGEYIIFGSGAARNIPVNFSIKAATDQIGEFLKLCDKYAGDNGLIVAIEPLNKNETNVINTVEEALKLISEINLSHIKVLADSYHMFLESEPFDILKYASNQLVHIHIADKNRCYPGQTVENGVDFKEFFSILKSIGYTGGISAECRFTDLSTESEKSLAFVKNLWSCLK